jgi:hypothetical protein
VQDVVSTLELAGSVQGEHVQRFLDDAQPALVPTRIAADGTQRLIADVEAALAEHDLIAYGDESRGEASGFGVGRAKQVVGQALSGLWPDPRESPEGLDEARDRLDERGGHAPFTCPAASDRQ